MEIEVGVMHFEDGQRGMNQEMQVVSRSQKRQEYGFSVDFPEGTNLCWYLDFSQDSLWAPEI